MKASLALAVFLMGACQPPEEEAVEDSGDTGLLELGSIEGNVSLEVDLEFSHDYTLFVLGSIETHESGVLPLRIHHTPVAMLSLEDGSLSFLLNLELALETSPLIILHLLLLESIHNVLPPPTLYEIFFPLLPRHQ